LNVVMAAGGEAPEEIGSAYRVAVGEHQSCLRNALLALGFVHRLRSRLRTGRC